MSREANRMTSESHPKSCCMPSLSLPDLVLSVGHRLKIALRKYCQRTQSTFFLVSNHVNSGRVHVNSQCFDTTDILKTYLHRNCAYIGFTHKKKKKMRIYIMFECFLGILAKP